MLDKEILDAFRQETKQLLQELEDLIEGLEEFDGKVFPVDKLAEFAQKIDRIMGAVGTLVEIDSNLKPLLLVSELAGHCKTTGYQAARTNLPELIPIFAGFWADVVDTIADALDELETPDQITVVTSKFAPVLQKRLTWLAEKVAKVSGSAQNTMLSQEEIQKLMSGSRSK